ncbi:contactin-associated protein-like 5 [Montipora foliosa]|uniref:contactin-associated protein-like 5 n=1 Tax=Montipora foliosa TaxID=591990 RepID=UPI0035F139AC
MWTVAALVCWLFLPLVASSEREEPYSSFDGKTYLKYSYNGQPRTLPDRITLVFKTIKPSGVLFLATSSGGDFIILELLRGRIRCFIFLSATRRVVTVYKGKNDLANNQWHQVEIKKGDLTPDNITLYIDVEKYFIPVPGFSSARFARQTYYLGGVDVNRIKTKHGYLGERDFVFHEGCLDNKYTKINGTNLLDEPWKKIATVDGNSHEHGSGCRMTAEGYKPITFGEPDSFIKVKAANNSTALYSFKFRTNVGEGILLSQRRTEKGAKISLSLVSGSRIRLDVEFVSDSWPVTLFGGSDLDDGMWHSVAVSINIQRVRLEVDNELTSQSQSSRRNFVSGSEVYVGASRGGFVGCMRDLIIQGQLVNFSTVYRSKVLENKCSIDDRCFQNPCKNNGKCFQRWNRTMCDCSGTDFKGPNCDTPAFFMQSCADWWAAGKTTNKYYRINPQHSEPFTVYCNMTNKNGPSTVIVHMYTGTNKVIAAESHIKGKYYQHDIFYENSNEQNIKNLIASSTHCRQYLQYKCNNSVLFDSPKAFNLSGRGARWVSRDGKIQDYWSGASPGSKQCACGVNRTCKIKNKACNCDIVDNNWHMDDGYLTDSESLPVKRLIFTVDGTSRTSYFVLGSLECFGSTTPRSTAFPATTYNATSPKSNESHAKFPTTTTFTATNHKDLSGKVGSTDISSPSTRHDMSSIEPHDTIVVIEIPRKHITIRESPNQQLVLIILSVILAVFVISIAVLILKQNTPFPCKCFKKATCHDEIHIDTIELAAHSLVEPEILQFQTSPYPARNTDCDIGHHYRYGKSSPEHYSDAETDRLDISNGSSSWNSENADTEKEEPKKIEDYKHVDLGLIDVIPFHASKQLSTEQQIIRLKEVIYDVLAAADVKVTHSDKNDNNTTSPIKRYKLSSHRKSDFEQSLINENESLESDSECTQTISEASSEIELVSEERSSERYNASDKETNVKELYRRPGNEIILARCTSESERRLLNENWYSTDPSDNYLSLDVNNLEDGGCRQSFSEENLTLSRSQCNSQTSPCSNLSYSHREQDCLFLDCDEKRIETTSENQNKRKQSSRGSRIFSRRKSEEEALLSSSSRGLEVNGLKQNKTDGYPETKNMHHSSIADPFYQQQQKQQHLNASKMKADTQSRESKKATAKALKQSHSQKYETEL